MSSSNTCAWVVNQKGQPARFQPLANTAPELQPGEVHIAGQYSAINYKDALSLTGHGEIARRFPLVVGQDMVGTILESRHSRLIPGQLVIATGCNLGETRHGTLAAEVVAPGDCVYALPAHWSAEMAAAVGTAGFTAAYALLKMRQAGQKPEDGPIIVTGATGGVGSHAVLLLAREGFETVALSRKTQCSDYLRQLGASRVIQRLPVQEESPPKPLLSPQWAGAIDSLGGPTLSHLLASTQAQGNVVSLGLVQSPQLQTTVLPFILRGINLLGLTSSHAPASWRKKIWDFLFSRLSADHYPIATSLIPLRDAQAHAEKMLSGDNFGRLIVDLRRLSQE